MRQGFLYLVAIIDWATRRVLSWRLSNTLTAGFCVEALSEALARFGKPGIFNTDQGAQFTSEEFTQMLRDHGVAIGMDGRGRGQVRWLLDKSVGAVAMIAGALRAVKSLSISSRIAFS